MQLDHAERIIEQVPSACVSPRWDSAHNVVVSALLRKGTVHTEVITEALDDCGYFTNPACCPFPSSTGGPDAGLKRLV